MFKLSSVVLGLVAVLVSVACDDGCYAPGKNTESAYEEGAIGCGCDTGHDEGVCEGRAALMCIDDQWQAVEDGPCFDTYKERTDCFSPGFAPEEAYTCGVRGGCECDPQVDSSVCVQGDGHFALLACVDGHWQGQEPSGCAIGSDDRCFSPDRNVDLALSGKIKGCACEGDEETCAEGAAGPRPMWCSGGEWHAEPNDFGCAEAWDLCAAANDAGSNGEATETETTETDAVTDVYL